MKQFLNWLRCRLFGHLRGKATGQILPGNMKEYACPRCSATWQRKANGNGAAQ